MQDAHMASKFAETDIPLLSAELVRGREGYMHSGALRTKPARADATTTNSHSCSDKLAIYSVIGIQGALLSQLVEPIYISSFVFGGIPPALQSVIYEECGRALSGRLGSIKGRYGRNLFAKSR